MARKSIGDAVAKWQQRVSQSGPYYQQGVQNTTKDWANNAQAAASRRNAGLQAAIADGRIDAGIQRAGTQKWRSQTLAKGVSAWTTNTPKAAPQYQAGLQKSYNYMSVADQVLSGMPNTTREERIQRSSAWQRVMGEQADAAKQSP